MYIYIDYSIVLILSPLLHIVYTLYTYIYIIYIIADILCVLIIYSSRRGAGPDPEEPVREAPGVPPATLPCPIPYTLYIYIYIYIYTMPCTLYPTPSTLYPISYTLYPVPYTLYPTPSHADGTGKPSGSCFVALMPRGWNSPRSIVDSPKT